MHCEHVSTPYGAVTVCGPRPRTKRCSTPGCSSVASKLCDGPGRRKGTTCDTPMCDAHAVNVGPDRDLCPACTQPQDDSDVREYRHLVAEIHAKASVLGGDVPERVNEVLTRAHEPEHLQRVGEWLDRLDEGLCFQLARAAAEREAPRPAPSRPVQPRALLITGSAFPCIWIDCRACPLPHRSLADQRPAPAGVPSCNRLGTCP